MTEKLTSSEFRLPVVHGRRSSGSNADFERACLVHIERLQHGLGSYDSAMMATFCEAVRMVREYSDAMQVRTPKPERPQNATAQRHTAQALARRAGEGDAVKTHSISDDDILSLWRTARPSAKQDGAMVYQTGPHDVDHPTFELRKLVELAMERGRNNGVTGVTTAGRNVP